MIGFYVMGVAMVLQFAAAVIALSHIRYTASYWAWTLLAVAMVLQGARRVATMSLWASEGIRDPETLVPAALSLAISVLMFGGVLLIGPLLKRVNSQRDELAALAGERTGRLRETAEELAAVNRELSMANDECIDTNRRLEIANARMEESARAKDRFVTSMSKELNTPLDSIIASSVRLTSEEPGPLNEEQLKTVAMIRSAGDHLHALIDELLDFEQMHAGGRRLRGELIHVSPLCDRVVKLARAQAETKGLSLVIDLPGPQVVFWGDPEAIEQILLCLLDNAIEYTEHGVVSLSGTVRSRQLHFEVTDTGPGIPADMLDTVFDEFERLGRDSVRGGTGLGLPLARGLARLHGGDVTVFSEPAAGSTFRVRLNPLLPV